MPSISLANRLGFLLLGLTNNFAYVIMLSAAYDLLDQTGGSANQAAAPPKTVDTGANSSSAAQATSSSSPATNTYCNEHSTSTILLADTLPGLATKLLYPFLLVGLPAGYKAIATALLAAAAFIITGLSMSKLFIFAGVACASLSSGLGESTYLSQTPAYGDVSLSGWSMGTGAAGLLGAIAYAVLRMVMPIKLIMMVMLIVPVAMLVAYFKIIEPVADSLTGGEPLAGDGGLVIIGGGAGSRSGVGGSVTDGESRQQQQQTVINSTNLPFSFREKVKYLPTLAKYFLPLLLVYFAEYFINQGLFELIYYPEVAYLDHGAQYRWFQVSYQLGVMISRSSLDFIQLKNIWAMSLLQFANTLLFLAHAAKLIHLPSFYLVIMLIVYEGLLGGFTYVNAFYRVNKETPPDRQEFSISTVTTADTLGIVMAGLLAIPAHNALCKLYV